MSHCERILIKPVSILRKYVIVSLLVGALGWWRCLVLRGQNQKWVARGGGEAVVVRVGREQALAGHLVVGEAASAEVLIELFDENIMGGAMAWVVAAKSSAEHIHLLNGGLLPARHTGPATKRRFPEDGLDLATLLANRKMLFRRYVRVHTYLRLHLVFELTGSLRNHSFFFFCKMFLFFKLNSPQSGYMRELLFHLLQAFGVVHRDQVRVL